MTTIRIDASSAYPPVTKLPDDSAAPRPSGNPQQPAVLADIVAHKRAEVALRKQLTSVHEFRRRIADLPRPRNFFTAVTRHDSIRHMSVIAEIKRRSPSVAAADGERGAVGSEGWIRPEYAREDFDPAVIARAYHAAGAAAISCLTDERFFAGKLEYIARVRDAVPLPVLRKDFILDPWQLYESRAAGADAVLLIAECLNESELLDLMILAQELQLTTLVEVHSMENLLRVRRHIGFPNPSYSLLGINNRDLSTMKTDLAHTLRMAELVDDPTVLVTESGIGSMEDLRRLRKVGVRIALIGESLMREEDPGKALRTLIAVPGTST